MKKEKGKIETKSFLFAIKIVRTCQYLTNVKKEYVMSRQLLRNGTAVGALSRESQNAESRADFIHKLAIAQKECDESIYWLELLNETKYLPDNEFLELNEGASALLKMIRSAILTTKQKTNLKH